MSSLQVSPCISTLISARNSAHNFSVKFCESVCVASVASLTEEIAAWSIAYHTHGTADGDKCYPWLVCHDFKLAMHCSLRLTPTMINHLPSILLSCDVLQYTNLCGQQDWHMLMVPWFPVSRGGEKEHLLSTVGACSSISQNSVSLTGISVTHSVRQRFYCVEDTTDQFLCKRWQGSNENTQLFSSKNYPHICPLQLELSTRWLDFLLKFTNHLQQNTDHYHQSDIISDFIFFQMCLTRSIALQCGLSAGKLKLVVILV